MSAMITTWRKRLAAMLLAAALLAGCSPAAQPENTPASSSGKSEGVSSSGLTLNSTRNPESDTRPTNKISRDGKGKGQTILLKATRAGSASRYWCPECQQYESLDDYADDDYDYCEECDGYGYDENDDYCEECDGYGYYDYDESEAQSYTGSTTPTGSSTPAPQQGSVTGAPLTAAGFTAKYGVTFTDPDGLYRSVGYSAMMERVMQSYSPELVAAVANTFTQNGLSTVIEIRNATSQSKREELDGEAFIDGKQAKMVIYAPEGMTDGIIAHEFGHMVHYALEYIYSEKAIEREWVSNNNGTAYNESYTQSDRYVFADEYGSTDYYEDIASNFEILIEKPGSIAQYKSGSYSAIWNKLLLLKRWCEENFASPVPLLAPIA